MMGFNISPSLGTSTSCSCDSHIGFGDHTLLPRGILREPLSHLRRANLFLLTKVENLETCKSLEKEIHEIVPSVPVFHSHYETGVPGRTSGGMRSASFPRGKENTRSFPGSLMPATSLLCSGNVA